MVNKLAPRKILQITKEWKSQLNLDVKDKIDQANVELDKAIYSGALEQWRLWHAPMIQVSKIIDYLKSKYYKNTFSKTIEMWLLAKPITNLD